VLFVADRIEMKRAKRRSTEGAGDLSLLVLVLTMLAGLGQLNFLIQSWLGSRVDSAQVERPSPELIARLLQREFDGERKGRVAHVERPQHRQKRPSYYMPSGSSGETMRPGGGERAGERAMRTPPSKMSGDAGRESKAPREDVVPKIPQPAIEALADVGHQLPKSSPIVEPSEGLRGLPPSVERFIGWGFHDWMEASDSHTEQVVKQLELARALMRLNPDEPYAILTVAYFAYLSENYELCQDLYRRYTTLYPEDAAGWNNLALTYKRAGQYAHEEQLYRRALALDPTSSNTQNNLAVNLAHQGRFDEAERIMAGLNPSVEERPYANLHRAKIAAAQGSERKAVRFLRKALADVDAMDTLHHIEFRQDIRLDPALSKLRRQRKVQRMLRDAYGEDTPVRLGARAPIKEEVGDG